MEKKKYEVVAEVTIAEVVQSVGAIVELTDDEAVEFGASIKLVEAPAPVVDEKSAIAPRKKYRVVTAYVIAATQHPVDEIVELTEVEATARGASVEEVV